MKQFRMLILEDYDATQKTISRIIAKFNAGHTNCSIAPEFLVRISELKTRLKIHLGVTPGQICEYDLIMLDNSVVDGFALAEEWPKVIRLQYPKVRIAFLSGDPFPKLAREVGATELDKNDIIGTLPELLDQLS